MPNTFRPPLTKQGISTFENIVNTGKRLFAEKGFHCTSINKIIEEAGIATGTYYIYFDDKLSLFKYIFEDYKIKINKCLNEATKNCKTRYEFERDGIKAFIKFAYEDTLSYNIILESLFVDRTLFIDYYEEFAKSYEAKLTEAKSTSEIRDVDTNTLAYMLMGISHFLGIQAIFKNFKHEEFNDEMVNKIINQVMDILENGMFAKR